VKDAKEHDAHREQRGNGGNTDVEYFSSLAESSLHKAIVVD
jgi:hypothetical protein